MKPKVFIARPIPAEAEAYIAARCDVSKPKEGERLGREAFFEAIRDAEGLLTAGTRIDAELLGQAPKLRVVSNISVGYNNYDLTAMKARGVIGTHTPGVLDDTVADLIVGLMLSAARRIPELDRIVRQGLWKKGSDEPFFGLDLHHRTVGIIGMGRIGGAVAKRAKLGFDMNVLYYNRSRNEAAETAYGAVYSSMDELLAASDFVVVMTPLTPQTERFFDAAHLAKMKRTAFFINASRGAVVDEAALVAALRDGTIAGAGLDVFEVEPVPSDHPLLSLPNVVLLPHIGSATDATRHDMAMLAARNLVAALTGEGRACIVPELTLP
ncbi:D-glycerate dehydrogenase [Paenibacillus sp. TRM 82003]|nr:D-glycerate dehydrogenase [Paenibacillus sp. TRM 82003]